MPGDASIVDDDRRSHVRDRMLRKQQIAVGHHYRRGAYNAIDGILLHGLEFIRATFESVVKIVNRVAYIKFGLRSRIGPIDTVERDKAKVMAHLQNVWVVRPREAYGEVDNESSMQPFRIREFVS